MAIGVGVVAVAALLLLIVFGPRHLVYDETYHIASVSQISRSGWVATLTSTTNYSEVGPLFAFVQVVCASLTKLSAPAIRYPNFFLFVAFLCAMAATGQRLALRDPVATGLSNIAVPFVWASIGMALTEIPALFCVTVGLWAVVALEENNERSTKLERAALVLLAGIFLGLACLGRQTYLVIVPALLTLCRRRIDTVVRPVLVGSIALAVCGWLFLIWKGLVPARARSLDVGLNWSFAILSIGYIAVATLFMNPRWLLSIRMASKNLTYLSWSVLAAAALFAMAFPMDIAPARTLTQRWLGPASQGYPRVVSAVLVAFAVLWLIRFGENVWAIRRDRVWTFLHVSLFLLVLTPVKITHQFSSRYVVTSLGLLTLVLWRQPASIGKWHVVRLALGAMMGAAILRTYYMQ